ncbi:hypothetical protein Clacol_007092 [Clathrus columnatus]|uniref:CCL2-like lectin domain-containing protein n=1 Tax=Clathrus columnatus TaxID=1419009 RepID=A0AAV5AGK3_9AGAM|nr:hypothetical protein Clacol_007092 [Clathrus columnatus]
MKVAFLLSLGMQCTLAQSFVLPNGTYHFVSRVLDAFGNELAITNNGLNTAITVSPLVRGQTNQLWPVTNFGTTGNQITVFATNASLEAGTSGTLPQPLMTLPNAPFAWAFTVVNGSLTISDPSFDFHWGISSPTSGSGVLVQTPAADFLQLWIPVLVTGNNFL